MLSLSLLLERWELEWEQINALWRRFFSSIQYFNQILFIALSRVKGEFLYIIQKAACYVICARSKKIKSKSSFHNKKKCLLESERACSRNK